MKELIERLLEGIEKKPPVKIADITPEERARYEELMTEGNRVAKKLAELALQTKAQITRFWLDIDDKYGTHTKTTHIHNMGLFEGTTAGTDHKDKDPLDD